MLRRRLTLYTLLYIAGIAAGFFMFERSRTTEAAGFCIAVIAAVMLTDNNSSGSMFYGRERTDDQEYSEKHLNIRKEEIKSQKAILIVMFFAGLLLFSIRARSYNAAMSYIADRDTVSGSVITVSVKDDKIKLIVKNRHSGPRRVLVTLDEAASERSAENARACTSEAFAEAYARTGAFAYTGMVIEARGEYTEIPSADDPGCFDYSLYMKSKGVTVRFKAYILEVTDAEIPLSSRIRLSLFSARERFISRFDTEMQGFIRGVIFGDKSEIDEDILEEFNSNSTGHILAVSGLHVGFLYGLLRFLTARRRTLPVSLMIIAVILLYGEMTMWSPATVRACIVMTISLCSAHFRRTSDLLTSVSLAAFLILTYQPYQLFNSGFQLSFLALCGIAFLTRPIASVTGEAIAVMLAVQAGTLPVIAYSYCRINPLSMLINIPVILLASVLVPLCIILLMLEAAVMRVPAAGIDLAELISSAVIKINHILNFGGSFSIKTAGPGAAVIIVIYVIVFGLASEWTRVMLLRKDRKSVLKQGILLMLPLVMLFSCLYDTISDDEIVFAAVGQGDCVHIRAEGHDVLIDGGGQPSYGDDQKKDTGYNVGKSILMPYLMHSGADAVDIALVTHLHADHYKGITELCEVFPVGAIGIPADYRGALKDPSEDSPGSRNNRSEIHCDPSKIRYIYPDTRIDMADDVNIEVIWPVDVSAEPLAADDPNEHNTVYMIRYKDIRIMVTGDLLEEDELEMVDYYKGTDKLRCDILKVAHHGSKSSSCEEFLDTAKPRIAVIQCGLNNPYGLPSKQSLERLEERGIQVFRTDLSGSVGIDLHGTSISIDLFKTDAKRRG